MNNLLEVGVNYGAVLISAGIAMLVGFLWYSPILFGYTWIKEMKWENKPKPDNKKMVKTYTISFLSSVIMMFVLAIVIKYFGFTTPSEGAITGMILWLGFIATTQLNSILYDRASLKLYAVNTGYHLVTLIFAGALLGVWQ